MTAYFWDLSYSVLVGLFFFFLSSFLFVCLIVCFVYEHFTCTWEKQALLLHMFPCTHYKLSNWSQYSILCSRPKTPILEFECKLLRGIHTECSEHFKWTWYFFAWADRAVLCSSNETAPQNRPKHTHSIVYAKVRASCLKELRIREHSLMMSLIFWPFLTYLPTLKRPYFGALLEPSTYSDMGRHYLMNVP